MMNGYSDRIEEPARFDDRRDPVNERQMKETAEMTGTSARSKFIPAHPIGPVGGCRTQLGISPHFLLDEPGVRSTAQVLRNLHEASYSAYSA